MSKITDNIKNKLRVYVNVVLLMLCISLFLSIFRNISRVQRAQERIDEAQQRVDKLKSENKELEVKLDEVQSVQFEEKQIRDKLGMAKEGEVVVILPEENVLRKLAPEIVKEEDVLPDPVWKKWMKLFI